MSEVKATAQEREYSAYSINAACVQDVSDLQKEKKLVILRIMHSEKLTSMRVITETPPLSSHPIYLPPAYHLTLVLPSCCWLYITLPAASLCLATD